MGVYIKGLEMPKFCKNCRFCVNMNEYPFLACFITQKGIPFDTDKMGNCPLVEIKTPHGRIIDADKIEVIASAPRGVSVEAQTLIEPEK